MDLVTIIYVVGLLLLTVIGVVGLVLSIRATVTYQRAERNIRLLLDDEPEREALAGRILQNPNMENIQKGRELVIRLVNTMSECDQREISRGLYQDSIKGRARYVAKLVTAGRSNSIRRIPTDQSVSV